MEFVYRQKLSNDSSTSVLQLRDNLEKLHSITGGVLEVITGCAGTEVGIYGLEVMTKVWADVFGIEFKLEHVWSSEKVEWKVDFIRQHFNPATIFPNVTRLSQEFAV